MVIHDDMPPAPDRESVDAIAGPESRPRDPRLRRAAAADLAHRRRIAELESMLWDLAREAELAGRDDDAARIRTVLDWQQDPEIDWRGIE